MTLDDLGNIGEFVGAIAVVVTLIYLALQVRQNTAQIAQNTKSVQLSALEANVTAGSRVRELLIVNDRLAELHDVPPSVGPGAMSALRPPWV